MTDETRWDRKLHIHTAGRDISSEDSHHFPYEPTPYSVLERLAESSWIGRDNHLLDCGCGKGRVSFFLHHRTGCRSTGIDFNPEFVRAANENRSGFPGKDHLVFLTENAERYEIPSDADRFYFFNPFSVKILQSVMGRILESWYEAPREILLLFYYPSDEYIGFLMGIPELLFDDELDCSDLFPGDRRERILCFALSS